jgi:hypothetical protein
MLQIDCLALKKARFLLIDRIQVEYFVYASFQMQYDWLSFQRLLITHEVLYVLFVLSCCLQFRLRLLIVVILDRSFFFYYWFVLTNFLHLRFELKISVKISRNGSNYRVSWVHLNKHYYYLRYLAVAAVAVVVVTLWCFIILILGLEREKGKEEIERSGKGTLLLQCYWTLACNFSREDKVSYIYIYYIYKKALTLSYYKRSLCHKKVYLFILLLLDIILNCIYSMD